MPTVGLIVEGLYDEAVIPVLVKRCRARVNVVTRKCRGSITGKLAGILAELERSSRADKVLVISDADSEQPSVIVKAISKRISGRFRFAIVPIVIVPMLEAWLLADPTALEKVVGISRLFARPERPRGPKAELRRLLTPRTAYTPDVALRIAEEIDLDLLGERCARFLAFRKGGPRPVTLRQGVASGIPRAAATRGNDREGCHRRQTKLFVKRDTRLVVVRLHDPFFQKFFSVFGWAKVFWERFTVLDTANPIEEAPE